jgi:hypothetical protein
LAERTVINDRYELEPFPIARGGMGEVWGGRDLKLHRKVAVKFVRFPDDISKETFTRRFVRESRITAQLQHPGVPAVFDVGTTEDGRPYLVMQRVGGISVSDLLAQHERLTIGWATAIAAQTCAVLTVAHQASLIHRDLKPANLMLEPEGTVKVLDFGLAVALELTDMSTITRTGESIGTPAYMAPEQVHSEKTGPYTDLYALGCTIYEMLTGQPVFTGANSYVVMSKQTGTPPTPVTALRPEIPDGLNSIVVTLLAKKPANRPDSASDVYEMLLPYATDLTPLPELPVPDSAPTRMYARVLDRLSPTARRTTPDQTPAMSTVVVPPVEDVDARAADLRRQERYGEAADVLQEALHVARQRWGVGHPDVIALHYHWADALFDDGDYRTAGAAYHDLVVALEERDGPQAASAFHYRSRYATCHAFTGDPDTALRTMRDLAADEQRILGRTDPRALEVRKQLGLMELGSGQRAEAAETLRALLDDLRREHGESHPTTRQVQELLADLPGSD